MPSVLLSSGRAINLMIAAESFFGCAAKRILRYHKARHLRRALCRNRPLTIDRVSLYINNVGAHWGNSWGGLPVNSRLWGLWGFLSIFCQGSPKIPKAPLTNKSAIAAADRIPGEAIQRSSSGLSAPLSTKRLRGSDDLIVR